MLDISVIVATQNRARFLEPCLVSLCEQTLDPSRFEICVVNNNCTDDTPEIVAKVAAHYPKHKLFMVCEPVAGLSRARNCGLAATSAPLAANIDDDGTVYPDWLELFIARFAEFGPELAVVSGEIEPVWGAPRPSWLTDDMLQPLSAKTALGTGARFISDKEWLMEGNACYRRSALQAAGGYPENLGRVGDMLLSCEGTALAYRIRQNAGREFFDPKIILRHFIHADRLTPSWFRRRYFWQGVSDYAMRLYHIKHNIAVKNEMRIDLPLNPADWQFINKETAENLEANLWHFQCLGFALAMTGLLPVRNI